MRLKCEVPCTTPVWIESEWIVGVMPHGQYVMLYISGGSALLVASAKPDGKENEKDWREKVPSKPLIVDEKGNE
jgi:hypothetical protein